VKPIQEERTAVGLAREIERSGLIPDEKIARAAEVAQRYARDAAKLGAARIEVLVTAPARQGKNGSELVRAISEATRLPVRPLSAEEEGRLAFAGVVSTFPFPRRASPSSTSAAARRSSSSERRRWPGWFRTLDIGSLRLRAAALRQRPARSATSSRAPRERRGGILRSRVPLPLCAVATGGTARSLRRSSGGCSARSSWPRPS
jgi:hypothetical protein